MLKLLEGGFTSLAHKELIELIRARVKDGRQSYLIVPEQQTVTAEAELCREFPPSSALCLEITNFTRFTNTAFRALGGLGNDYCDGAVRSLIMWQVLTELSPRLNMTRGRTEISSGTVERALGAVSELESMAIEPERLTRAEVTPEKVGRRLYEKAHDIEQIYGLYKKTLTEKYSDVSEDCIALAGMLEKDGSFISGCEIFIDGFTSFTEPQYALIAQLIRHCPVTVSLVLPKHLRSSWEYTEIRDTEERLKTLAKRTGADVSLLRPDGRDMSRAAAIGLISEQIFSGGDVTDEELIRDAKGAIRVLQAETPFAECDFVAEDIRRLVGEGASYRDFAIIARRAEDYIGILDNSLTKSSVPFFISKQKSLDCYEAVKLIYTAYSTVDRGFAREDVIAYSKCGLTGLRRDEADRFELYCDRWGVNGKRFTDDEPWMMNPKGLEPHTEDTARELDRINGIRSRLIDPLKKLKENSSGRLTVREHAAVLFGYLTDVGLEKSLVKRANELLRINENGAAEENSRLFGIICESLDKLVDVLGDTVASRRSFINRLSVVFSAVGIGRIPANQDEVTVGSADMIRLIGKKHVYLLGVNAGEFPAAVKDGSFFTAKDKVRLTELDIPLRSDTELRNAKELYYFQRAFTFAHSTVTLLFSSKDATLKSLRPSSVIERLESLTRGRLKARRTSDIPLNERIYSPAMALEMRGEMSEEGFFEVRAALNAVGYKYSKKMTEAQVQNTELKLTDRSLGLVYNGELYLSQTKIDRFVSCPMSYLCSYVLKLKPQEKAEFDNRATGSFIHSILENFFLYTTKEGLAPQSLTRDQMAKITRDSSHSFVTRLLGNGQDSGSSRLAVERLSRVALPVVESVCRELSASKFKPIFFELPIKKDDPDCPDPIIISTRDGGTARIEGVVDRVDSFKLGDDVYVRVMDYKTGTAEVNREKIKDGESLQMLLYLKAITESKSFKPKLGAEGGEVIPAGVLYIGCDVKDTKLRKNDEELAHAEIMKKQTRDGIILAEEAALEAMNPDYMPKDKPTKRYTLDEWKQISETVEDVVRNITDRMKSGESAATPCNKCEYCGFGPICRNQKKRSY